METTRLFEQDNTDIVSDLRRITGGSAVTSVTARAADAIEALVKERDHWHERWDRAVEREDWALMDRLHLAAVIEKAKGYLNDSWLAPFNPGETGHDILIILTTAPADALREHDAKLIEHLLDEAILMMCDDGVRVYENREAFDRGVPKPPKIKDWLAERARRVREGEA